ncbi:PREDICTED: PI-PLC X domain-containing protein 2 isoform X1 [Chinchilla lanigera]|uniref:PI-PLC X domain-containing protein 2 isoform X1 n=1 Tax=Chinchilla lanigera TaxID=34839 RepID=UPI00038EE781|nr:PREDICTED: PI-PLC X domain-containing protein 2 isoform X1 [Chinchilla lanigera]
MRFAKSDLTPCSLNAPGLLRLLKGGIAATLSPPGGPGGTVKSKWDKELATGSAASQQDGQVEAIITSSSVKRGRWHRPAAAQGAGSHDSFSYWVDEKSPVGPDQTPAIKRLARISLVKKLMKKWSVTQNLTFREQLEAGIRYFDLRVSSKPGATDQEIYFIHGLFGIKVWDGLMEIDSFLAQHPQEIVFLDFNHFYAMDEAHHKRLILQIQEAFGNKLCPACSVESLTLQTLWEKKCQVLIFYHCPLYKQYSFLWPGKKIPAPWANTTSVRKLILFLETTLSERAPRGSFHVSQAILTPRVKTIARGLVGGLKNTLVHRNLPAILDWVKIQKPGAMGVNIITSDFVDLVDFATTVIELNDLLQADRSLAKC